VTSEFAFVKAEALISLSTRNPVSSFALSLASDFTRVEAVTKSLLRVKARERLGSFKLFKHDEGRGGTYEA